MKSIVIQLDDKFHKEIKMERFAGISQLRNT